MKIDPPQGAAGMNAGEKLPATAPASTKSKAAAVRKKDKADKKEKPDARAGSLKPISDSDFGYDEARHLLWRAGFGGTAQQIQTLAGWGAEKSVDYLLGYDQVKFASAKNDDFDKDIMRPPSADERAMYAVARRSQDENALAEVRRIRQQREGDDRRQMREVQKWWLKRMIETPRPLEEKMTLFWHGHFATSYRTIENSYHMFLQNELFRKHAIGNFGELLFGIIRDPAMLAYLDNNDSRKGRANENLAREIMELFALGIGGYSEQDIKEGARALTGYTFDDDEFVFQKNNHDDGNKTILGVSGKLDGDGFVKAILQQRAVAQYIPRKIYHYFAEDLPPLERASEQELPADARTVIRAMGDSLLSARYDLKPMLRRLFLSEHFYSREIMGQHIKSPCELVVGSVRSLNTPVRDLSILGDALDLMGQNIFFPPSVKGWDGGRSWINTSTLFVRQNILAFLLSGKKPVGYDATADTQPYDPALLLDELARAEPGADRKPDRVIDYLLRLTLGGTPEGARTALKAFVAKHNNQVTRDTLVGMLLLITAMPEYQLC
jgi:uncharacterized protein (DUF1800 family)